MIKQSIINKLKSLVSSIGWALFIWGIGITKEEYWKQIYEQEKKQQDDNNTRRYSNVIILIRYSNGDINKQ